MFHVPLHWSCSITSINDHWKKPLQYQQATELKILPEYMTSYIPYTVYKHIYIYTKNNCLQLYVMSSHPRKVQHDGQFWDNFMQVCNKYRPHCRQQQRNTFLAPLFLHYSMTNTWNSSENGPFDKLHNNYTVKPDIETTYIKLTSIWTPYLYQGWFGILIKT